MKLWALAGVAPIILFAASAEAATTTDCRNDTTSFVIDDAYNLKIGGPAPDQPPPPSHVRQTAGQAAPIATTVNEDPADPEDAAPAVAEEDTHAAHRPAPRVRRHDERRPSSLPDSVLIERRSRL